MCCNIRWVGGPTISQSNLPIIYIGDYVIAQKDYYRAHLPQVGDVIVFALPRDPSIDYAKRIVGLPGDHVQMRDGDLYINDRKAERQRIASFEYRGLGGVQRIVQYIETLPNGVQHPVLALWPSSSTNNTKVFVVPSDNYFVLGDNRDNSTDSRFSRAENGVGFVPLENIRDRLELIYWSKDWRRIGTAVR
jgi:signal peptidase I